MSLRRIAQANAAIQSSPRVNDSAPSTPARNTVPSTPRTRLVYPISPVTSPSLSASTPFDWEAARARKPAPYASPLAGKQRARLGGRQNGSPTKGGPSKRVIRKKGFVEKITSIPSQIAFEISLFPHNVPLPTPKKAAWILGGFLHFMHICVRWSQTRQLPESELPWEMLIREEEGLSWFDWTTPTTIVLVLSSLVNALHLFTQTRIYQLNLAKDPVSSPNASFVPRPETLYDSEDPSPSLVSRLLSFLRLAWRGVSVSARFLFNLTPPKDKQGIVGSRTERVQQLEVWTPGDLEMRLFAIYSPVHALLWMLTTGSNLAMMSVVMFLVGVQIRALTRSFEVLLKDRAIISAEMLHEYDEKFVFPRINPIRKDAAVMTHQAEMVHVWEDHPRRHHTPGR